MQELKTNSSMEVLVASKRPPNSNTVDPSIATVPLVKPSVETIYKTGRPMENISTANPSRRNAYKLM
jgi:hypothetical protein